MAFGFRRRDFRNLEADAVVHIQTTRHQGSGDAISEILRRSRNALAIFWLVGRFRRRDFRNLEAVGGLPFRVREHGGSGDAISEILRREEFSAHVNQAETVQATRFQKS